MITGPGSPSVLSNMAVSIEQHVDWVVDRLIAMREAGFTTIEATETAQAGWAQHMADCSMLTLHRLANTWYTGANVPGKAQGVMPYTGGVGPYRGICNEVVSRGMLGFRLTGQRRPRAMQRRRDRSPATGRAAGAEHAGGYEVAGDRVARSRGRARLRRACSTPAVRPAGRSARSSTAHFPAPTVLLPYRLYRPATPGPHPIVVYFHGGGWVLGDEQSDDPFCRDMCRRSGMIFVSVGYRHAPEHRFPTAAEDGYAATRWIAEHAAELGGQAGTGPGRGLERRRQHRRRHLPAGARSRRPADRRPTFGLPGHRLRHSIGRPTTTMRRAIS